jgi:glycosyltransferase involved in cell wall biosynthesis
MTRVCLVRQKMYPGQRNLRRSAETLVKERYEVDVICVGLKGQPRRETVNGVNVHRIYYLYHQDNVFWYLFDYISFFILASLTLAWLSIKKRFDVIEVHTMPDFLVFVTLFPKLLGSKVILYMFENMTQLFTTGFGVSRKHIAARLVILMASISAHYADSVIVSDGPLHKKEVESYGIPDKKITLVLNVPDESVFKLNSDRTGTIDNSHFHLVVVSSILKRYGIQTLITAAPLLVQDIPGLKIHIIGEGPYYQHLEQLAHDLGVEPYVEFTGFISYEDIPSYIAQADICLAPAIDDVGAPNKIFEYSALRKPTVASDLPGIKSVFDDSSVQYYHPGSETELAELVLELHRHPEKRASLGNSAYKVYCRYRWPIMKQEYLGVYKRLLG